MPRIALHTRLDSTTAAYARLEAERFGSSISEWLAGVVRRELRQAGAADALAPKADEIAVANSHLLHALIIDSLGPEATAQALENAEEAAAEDRPADGAGRGAQLMIRGSEPLSLGKATDYAAALLRPAEAGRASAPPAKGAGRASAAAEWRALEVSELYAAQRLAAAIYQAEFARGLQALGYEVRADTKDYARIPGIPQSALAAFSKRRKQILDELARQSGSSAAADPQRAVPLTRRAKIRDVDPAALRAAWCAEVERLGIDLAELHRAADERLARGAAGGQPAAGEPLQQARASLAWAVEHLGERQAAFRVMDLEASALSHGAARGPGLDEIRAAVATHPGLIKRQSPTP